MNPDPAFASCRVPQESDDANDNDDAEDDDEAEQDTRGRDGAGGSNSRGEREMGARKEQGGGEGRGHGEEAEGGGGGAAEWSSASECSSECSDGDGSVAIQFSDSDDDPDPGDDDAQCAPWRGADSAQAGRGGEVPWWQWGSSGNGRFGVGAPGRGKAGAGRGRGRGAGGVGGSWGAVMGGPGKPAVPPPRLVGSGKRAWIRIVENEYLHRRPKLQRTDEVLVCQCVPPPPGRREKGCGESCLNRLVSIECQPKLCPCGAACANQQFQQRRYVKVEIARYGRKGYGVRARQAVAAGQFIVEYVGEVLNRKAFAVRLEEYRRAKQRHYYFMTLNNSEAEGAAGQFIVEYVGEVLNCKAFAVRLEEYRRAKQRHYYFMTLNNSEARQAAPLLLHDAQQQRGTARAPTI
ncbi:unnamed protein product [Closterium sp. Naga37s-1]|nr:unnamed protein product [Closterium sp. Naga37s-1]